MKSITINGLTFTDTPPTKEGWWLWSPGTSHRPTVHHVIPTGDWVRDISNCSTFPSGGFWAEMVPRQTMADEVEKAWREGLANGLSAGKPLYVQNMWQASRAKRIAEGKADQ